MNKNTVLFALACDSIIRDDITSRPAFIGVFDFLIIPKEEVKIIYTFMIGGKTFIENPLSDMKVRIYNPDKQLFKEVTINISGITGDTDFRSFFPLTEFTKEGKYLIKIAMDGVEGDDGDRFYFEVKKLL